MTLELSIQSRKILYRHDFCVSSESAVRFGELSFEIHVQPCAISRLRRLCQSICPYLLIILIVLRRSVQLLFTLCSTQAR